ncbi:MAG: hypothetical protein A2W25_13215 [candidate division Zixibacteria bacterium RBG_16_53_22]|nr:MAG: hypothetical protein A2W25_13215 [candidate division Zixibacteria bacterium RBG_16_53_22]
MADLKGTPNQALLGATIGFFSGFAAVALFGPTAGRFQDVLKLDPVLIGFLIAMPSLSGSLLRIPFSAWVDTAGGRKPFIVLLLLSILGMLGLFLVVHFLYPEKLTPNLYPLLLLLGLLCGCGIATFSVGISQVSYWFPQKRQGSALGAYGGIGNLAPGIFSFALPIALTSWGLAGSYLAWLLFLIIGTLLYVLITRNSYYFQLIKKGHGASEARRLAGERSQELFPTGKVRESLRISASIWKTWALVGIYFATFGGFIALTAWLPTYWKSFHEVSAVTAGMLTALYSILASVMRVAGGTIADRLGGERTIMLSLTVMLVGAVLMATTGNFNLSIAAEIILAMGMGITNAAVFKLVPQEVPQAVGATAGWVGGLGAFGGFAIPPVMSLFVSGLGKKGYISGFLVFVALAAIGILLAWILERARQKEIAAVSVRNLSFRERKAERGSSGGRIVTITISTGLLFSVIVLMPGVGAYRLPGNQKGYEPNQPIDFSHRLHAGEMQIPCLYCHSSAETSRYAGIPTAGTCMNCHKFVTAALGAVRAEDELAAKENRDPRRVVSLELKKLYQALGLDENLNRGSAADSRPIEWTKVHNVPDFVYFNHSSHVNVDVACQTCHGPVETMERVRQVESLSMGWCVNCHRDANTNGLNGRAVKASIDCAACHF